MVQKSLLKKVLSLTMAAALVLGGTSMYKAPDIIARADEAAGEVNPLTTVVKTANVGDNTGGSYTLENGKFTVNGAGTKFDKDSGNDNYFYTYFQAAGNTTVTAKLTPAAGNAAAKGYVGIIAKNGLEATDYGAGVYYDYDKNNLRAGRHGGAGNIKGIADLPLSIWVKLEFSKDAVYYTVGGDADFTDANIIQTRKGMSTTGLEHTVVGIFATDGCVLTVEDLRITTEYTDDLGEAVKKVVYDSAIGELIPTFSKSSDYGGKYAASYAFESAVDGNILKMKSIRGADGSGGENGKIREGENVDYFLFPAIGDNCTVSADITINEIRTNTDRQGVSIGQWAISGEAIAGNTTRLAGSSIQATKNNNAQHVFTSPAGNASGAPKASDVACKGGSTYSFAYTKNAATSEEDAGGTVTVLVKAANGTKLSEDTAFTLKNAHELLAEGKPVQYGIAVTAADVEIANLKLVNSDGWVIYDQNDYYIAKGVAPTITSLDKPVIADDRSAINLKWTSEGGVGNVQYVVEVSKDGGATYTTAGVSKAEEFAYVPDGDATYKFRVWGKSGNDSGQDRGKESEAVEYITPLATPALSGSSSDKTVTLGWTPVEGADQYDLYRNNIATGEMELIKSFTTETSYTEEMAELETYFYYMIAKNTTTGNTSNPSKKQQVLTNTDRTSTEYLFGDEAAKITITEKSNDTVLDGKASVKGTVDRAGIVELVNAKGDENKVEKTVNVSANGEFSFDIELTEGRNEYEILFRETADAKAARMTLNFVYLKKWDITVDAAFAGENGVKVDGVPTYKTIQAAVDSVPADNSKAVIIFIKNGDYDERVVVNTPYISMLGEDRDKTRAFHSVAVADGTATGMWDRNAFLVDSKADNFTMENMTVENSYNYTNGSNEQADALAIAADEVLCVNVKLLGYQDTLLVDSRIKDANGNYEVTRQYFHKCYITGNVDFIYGAGSAVFTDCDIVARYTPKKADGCFTAARTYTNAPYGLTFMQCRFLKEDGVAAGAYRLARPWGPDAATVLIQCYLSDVVAPAGYGDMSGNTYQKARFAEWLTYGPGFAVDNDRINMTSVEAAEYMVPMLDLYAYTDGADAMYIAVDASNIVAEANPVTEDVLTDKIKEATGVTTVEELKSYLVEVIVGDKGGVLNGVKAENTAVVDIRLVQVLSDGRKIEVTKDNFPEGGIDIVIPYPEGTKGNKDALTFVIGHLNDEGVMEYYAPSDIEKIDDGLKIHVTGTSPFVIGWTEAAADDPASETTQGGGAGTGDTTDMTFYMLLMAFAVLAGGTAFSAKKRRAAK